MVIFRAKAAVGQSWTRPGIFGPSPWDNPRQGDTSFDGRHGVQKMLPEHFYRQRLCDWSGIDGEGGEAIQRRCELSGDVYWQPSVSRDVPAGSLEP